MVGQIQSWRAGFAHPSLQDMRILKHIVIQFKRDRLLHLLLEYVHRSLVCFELLVLEEDPPL